MKLVIEAIAAARKVVSMYSQMTVPKRRHRKRQHRADDQTDDDAKDEADLIVLLHNGFCTIHHIKHSSVFVRPRRTLFLSLTQRQLLL